MSNVRYKGLLLNVPAFAAHVKDCARVAKQTPEEYLRIHKPGLETSRALKKALKDNK